jgi:hypothetical protein
MQNPAPSVSDDPRSRFYADALKCLSASGIPFLIGGAFAFAHYTGLPRFTKDLDVFVTPSDCPRALAVFEAAGFRTELTFPHWLGKVHCGEHIIDVIFGSGNGTGRVDGLWFAHAVEVEIFGLRLPLCPAEEIIWSKAFVQERERFDGADVMHLLRAVGSTLDWDRLMMRFRDHWRVLLTHLVMFGYVYPDHRQNVPRAVLEELLHRLWTEPPEPENHVCYGPLLSREQYLDDLVRFGYEDGRLRPHGTMTREEVNAWTAPVTEDRDA